jgi:hypothetical protein
MRWDSHVACMVKMGKELKLLVAKPEGKRPLHKYRRKWKDNIKMHFKV